ncbi:hypothetical protein [Streptomyces sp. NPDC057616]|uniref:hypothetical protein n=1 Tax=Streptomyces sp. NPDC057616 TaxID=3346183 RepID=UPI003690BAA7
MSRLPAATAIAATALAPLTACTLPDGPPGVVVARADRWSPATQTRHYSLTVRTADGHRKEFPVPVSDFRHCPHSSPNCKER